MSCVSYYLAICTLIFSLHSSEKIITVKHPQDLHKIKDLHPRDIIKIYHTKNNSSEYTSFNINAKNIEIEKLSESTNYRVFTGTITITMNYAKYYKDNHPPLRRENITILHVRPHN